MRCVRKNQQKMKYSLQLDAVPKYVRDEDGNEIFILNGEGEKIPLDTGETEIAYSKPVDFAANITNKLDDVLWKEYGADGSANFAQILAEKGTLPLKAGSVVWKKSEVGYKDSAKTVVDANTADYTVGGVNDEGLYFDYFLLQRNLK